MSPTLYQVHLVTVDGTEWLTKPFEGDAADHLQRLIHDEHIDSYEIVVRGTTIRTFVEPATVSFTRGHIVALWVEAVGVDVATAPAAAGEGAGPGAAG